ncbi:MAG: sugar phosphate isomerase/epimerase [Planctomycetes bacterium]|nr:sugar phosphate isomerase/epimerase [Planctomycetota bacterium]
MLLGVDSWSFSFAFGIRDVKPARRMAVWDMLAKVREWGLKGAQVGVGDMPKLGSPEFESLRKAIEKDGLFWEVSAGMVQREDGVLRALEYDAALGTKVVRAFMEGFGIQFKGISLDDYVSDAISHIKNLLPEFERRGLLLCLENHGGLRMKHLRRVLETFPSKHLGLCLDTGNPVLTLEDPIEIIKELAPRTYTCHLKDWNLIRSRDGLIARGCALGDGVVDLPAAVEILGKHAPFPDELHLNIESAQEYIPLKVFTSEFWRHCPDVTGAELGNILRLAEQRNMPTDRDVRIASMRGESESAILAEEEAAMSQSVRYCRERLKLL